MKKFIIILAIFLAFFVCIPKIISWGWERGSRDLKFEVSEVQYKILIIDNKFNNMNFFIDLNFIYTSEDSCEYISDYNKRQEIRLSSSNHSFVYLPILKNDSISFPITFYIKIYDENKTCCLKILDYDSFIEYTKPMFYTNENNPLTANEWTLTIDSTLLGLDKIKTDSIK